MREQGREIVMIGHAGHPGGRRHDGADATAASISSNRSADVAASRRCATRSALAYVTQTTLSVDDAAAIVAALKRTLSGDRRPEEGRHLLRDAEPAGCGEVHGAAASTS